MVINLIIILIILLIYLLFFFRYGDSCDNKIVRKKYIFWVSVVLIMQSGLRHYSVGADTEAYMISFKNIQLKSWESLHDNFYKVYFLGIGKDAGYDYFEKIFQIFSKNYQIFLIFIALIFFIALGRFLYKNTTRLSDLLIAYTIYSALFYGFYSITGIRQTIAASVCIFVFEYMKERKFILFLIPILIVSTIHKSALLFVPFYFLGVIKKTDWLTWLSLILFPVIMLFRVSISTFFKEIGGYEDYGVNKAAGTSTFTVLFVLIYFAFLLRKKYIDQKYNITNFYSNALVLALLLIPLTWVNPSAMRVVQYYSIFILIVIPMILNSLDEFTYSVKFGGKFFVLFILLLFFVRANMNTEPYHFFWNSNLAIYGK